MTILMRGRAVVPKARVSMRSYRSAKDRRYTTVLRVGNWTMLITTACILLSVVLSYGYEQTLSIPALIFWHTATVVCAGLLKIGYLLRCSALNYFGNTNF